MCEPFDEEYVRLLLDGSEDEVREGVGLIHQHLCFGICGWLRERFPSFQSEDLEDLWSEVIIGILHTEDFDPEQPLLPWLCTIAQNSAVDRLRRQASRDRVVNTIGEFLRDTQVGGTWNKLDLMERREVMELIRKAISQLPTRQKLIMGVFVGDFPETASMPELQRLVSERTGRPETLAAVKRALQEARAKVRKLLGDNDYNFGKQGKL